MPYTQRHTIGRWISARPNSDGGGRIAGVAGKRPNAFAHGAEELRKVPWHPKYETQVQGGSHASSVHGRHTGRGFRETPVERGASFAQYFARKYILFPTRFNIFQSQTIKKKKKSSSAKKCLGNTGRQNHCVWPGEVPNPQEIRLWTHHRDL